MGPSQTLSSGWGWSRKALWPQTPLRGLYGPLRGLQSPVEKPAEGAQGEVAPTSTIALLLGGYPATPSPLHDRITGFFFAVKCPVWGQMQNLCSGKRRMCLYKFENLPPHAGGFNPHPASLRDEIDRITDVPDNTPENGLRTAHRYLSARCIGHTTKESPPRMGGLLCCLKSLCKT